MYDENILQIPFFKSIGPDIKSLKIDNVVDSLTKVIQRKYILDYAKYLLKKKIPFSIQIVDIDNFKLINDNYGHQIGDEVLYEFGQRMVDVVGDKGLVGRYGGDEFIAVLPHITKYEDTYGFIKNYFKNNGPMRNWYHINNFVFYLTGTIGSASFPQNALSYEELFHKADQALYRGKEKGRNCFIVYVYEKHKDIDINKCNKKLLYEIIYEIEAIMEMEDDKDYMINLIDKYLIRNLRITSFNYFDIDEIDNIDYLLNEKEFFSCSDTKTIDNKAIKLKEYCEKNAILSILISKISYKGKDIGYIMFNEKNIQRIWQDTDISLLMFISKLFTIKYCIK